MSRKEFEMSEQDMNDLLDACKSAPLIMLQCGTPPSPQEMANRAWEKLGDKMGFDHMTVKPVDRIYPRVFTAEVKDDD